MSTHNNPQNEQNANLFGAILMITAVIIIATLALNRDGFSLVPAVPTATATPTEEIIPTNTPEPTIIPTEVPTEIPTEVPATDAPPTEEASTGTGDSGTDDETTSAAHNYPPELVAQGQELYFQCAACHGPDGRGVAGLGKDLVESEFVHSKTDEELLDFVLTGRPIWDPENTTGIDMPPKGGNPALSNDEILAIIAYIRTLGADDEASIGEGETAETSTDMTISETSTSADVSHDYDPALVTKGQELFFQCAACHGPDGRGVAGLGKDLVESEFVHAKSDEELLDFVLTGRPIWDAENTTGIDMPPKGGNPALSNDEITAIIAYIRTLTP